MNIKAIITAVLITVSMTSCAMIRDIFHSEEPPDYSGLRFSQVMGNAIEIQEVPVMISEKKFRSTLASTGNLPKIRLVPIYDRDSGPAPQGTRGYRVFQVHPKGPFAMLGLNNGDILYAAQDRFIFSPRQFVYFPEALLIDKKSTMTYRHNETWFRANIELLPS